MYSYKLVFTAGFAMFSMFFGSGNLVFPLLIGYETTDFYTFAIVGLLITAVCVPFLGLLGMIKFNGDRKAYFSSLGKVPAFVLTFLMLALMGPFGVIPRCITVAFGGLSLIIPGLPFVSFSFIFCLLIGVLIWQRNRIVDIIALILTPFKLGSIILLIIAGLYFGNDPLPSLHTSKDAFLMGVMQGYQTMDLIAAFFFACTIYEYLQIKTNNQKNIAAREHLLFKMGVYSSLIGAMLLSLVYVGFVMLGAKYALVLRGVPAESMLTEISRHALGVYAMPIVALTLAISCLATATVLTNLFVDFLQSDISLGRLTRPYSIFLTLTITFGISLLGFQFICVWLGSILEWIYPLLLVYAIAQIIRKTSCFKTIENYQ